MSELRTQLELVGSVVPEERVLYAPVVVADAIDYEVISVRSELHNRP